MEPGFDPTSNGLQWISSSLDWIADTPCKKLLGKEHFTPKNATQLDILVNCEAINLVAWKPPESQDSFLGFTFLNPVEFSSMQLPLSLTHAYADLFI